MVTPQETKKKIKNRAKFSSKKGLFWLFSFSLKGLEKSFSYLLVLSTITGVFAVSKLFLVKSLVDSLPLALNSKEFTEPLLLFGWFILVITIEILVIFHWHNAESSFKVRREQILDEAYFKKVVFDKEKLNTPEKLQLLEDSKEACRALFELIFYVSYYLPIFAGIIWLYRPMRYFLLVLGIVTAIAGMFLSSIVVAFKAESQKTTKDLILKKKNFTFLTDPGFTFERTVYNLESYLLKGFTRSYFKNHKRKVALEFTRDSRKVVVFTLYLLSFLLTIMIFSRMSIGYVTLGYLVSALYTFKLIWSFLDRSLELKAIVTAAKGSLLKEFNAILSEETKPRTHSSTPIDMSELVGFEIRDLSFRIDDKPFLEGINLKMKPGEKVAIIGESGSGKTTLLNVILGRYEKTSGEIYIGGIDKDSLKDRSSRFIGVVFEDPLVLPVSLKENITMKKGEGEGLDTKLQSIVSKVGLGNFLSILPQGMETKLTADNLKKLIDEDRNILIKKLALARALCQDPSVVFIDDVTFTTEKEKQSFMTFLSKFDRTLVWFSQNPNAAVASSRIVFLKDGRIVEEGTFEGLVQSGGEFARYITAYRGLKR